jgi:Antibiotic biosynthesis monooxygenase
MAQPPVLEVVLFKLKPGADEAAFLAASEAVMPDLRAMRGFIRRELFKDTEGHWMDTVHWHSLDDAHHAAEAFLSLSCAQTLIALIDEPSMTMLHLEPVQAYSQPNHGPGARAGCC